MEGEAARLCLTASIAHLSCKTTCQKTSSTTTTTSCRSNACIISPLDNQVRRYGIVEGSLYEYTAQMHMHACYETQLRMLYKTQCIVTIDTRGFTCMYIQPGKTQSCMHACISHQHMLMRFPLSHTCGCRARASIAHAGGGQICSRSPKKLRAPDVYIITDAWSIDACSPNVPHHGSSASLLYWQAAAASPAHAASIPTRAPAPLEQSQDALDHGVGVALQDSLMDVSRSQGSFAAR